jgi:hypothetical protein
VLALVGWIIVGIVTVGLLSLPKWLADLGWEKGGKWLKIARILNTIWIAIAGLITAYTFLVGAEKLLYEHALIALLGCASVAYIVCFYVAKSAAKQKTELTPKLAEQIIKQYGDALAREIPDDGLARYESFLPCPKERLKQAFKVMFAFLIEYEEMDQPYADHLLTGITYLGQFEPDEKARHINALRANGEPYWHEFDQFEMASRAEIDRFIEEVSALDSSDPLFHQQVYSLIGLEYSAKLRRSFREFYLESSGLR